MPCSQKSVFRQPMQCHDTKRHEMHQGSKKPRVLHAALQNVPRRETVIMAMKIVKYLLLVFVVVAIGTTLTACSKQCKATRSNGEKCVRKAERHSDYCYFHMTKDQTVRRCESMTNKGTRCKLPAESNCNFCEMHNVAPKDQCKAITNKGTRCSRAATKGGSCTQHDKMI